MLKPLDDDDYFYFMPDFLSTAEETLGAGFGSRRWLDGVSIAGVSDVGALC